MRPPEKNQNQCAHSTQQQQQKKDSRAAFLVWAAPKLVDSDAKGRNGQREWKPELKRHRPNPLVQRHIAYRKTFLLLQYFRLKGLALIPGDIKRKLQADLKTVMIADTSA
jgi:hypothetical protein